MRMMMKVQMPVEAGNQAIQDGSLPQIVGKALESLRAEAAYFISEEGMRTALIFFDMADPSDIPPAAEPFFAGLHAKVTFCPAMNQADLQTGMQKLGAAS